MPCDLRKMAALIFLRDILWCLMSFSVSVIPSYTHTLSRQKSELGLNCLCITQKDKN